MAQLPKFLRRFQKDKEEESIETPERSPSFLYIVDQKGNRYYMDATVDVTYQLGGNPTEYAVESGSNVSDHYRHDPDTLTYTGFISNVKFKSDDKQSTSLEEFERGLTALKKSGRFFTCSFSNNLAPMKYCLFTSLSMTRSTETGRNTLHVSFSIKKVIIASRAGIVRTPAPAAAYEDKTKERGSGSAGMTDVDEGKSGELFRKIVNDNDIIEKKFKDKDGNII